MGARLRYLPPALTAEWSGAVTWILGFAHHQLTRADFRDVGLLGV